MRNFSHSHSQVQAFRESFHTRILILSLALRTSYHVYYGLGFVLTIPFGYFVTRSFQKNRRLTRPIAAHFLWDAILITIAVLT